MGFPSIRAAFEARIRVLAAVAILCAAHPPAAQGDEATKTAKAAELFQLQGLAHMMDQSKAAWHEATTQLVRSMTDERSARFPNISPDKRAAIEAVSRQSLSEFENSFDRDDALRAWERLYSDGLTEPELEAIVAYYRSPVGQKDIRASQAALPQFQKYMLEKRTAAMNEAIERYSAAVREIASPSKSGSIQPAALPMRPSGSNPSAPEGKVIPDSVSDRCEVAPSAPSRAARLAASGRSVLCVCVDERGRLTQDPLIAESSGDSRVDSGAVKLARSGSGRYAAPTLDGKPHTGCFRFAINFRHPD